MTAMHQGKFWLPSLSAPPSRAHIMCGRQCRTVPPACRNVRRLQKRYTPNPYLDPDPPTLEAGQCPSLSVPIVFISLLRKGTPDKDRSEAKLASAFDTVSHVVYYRRYRMYLQIRYRVYHIPW